MRENIKEFVEIVSRTLALPEPIFEFGSFQVPEQLGYADLRPFFPGRAYVGCDMREGPGVERIRNLHAIAEPSGSVGTVLCLDTLEHVEHPRTAVEEMYRILSPAGVLVMSSVMCFPIHDHPFDYWRFTPEAFRSLLKPFAQSFVGFRGAADFPHTIVGVGFKGPAPELQAFEREYSHWKDREPRPSRASSVAASLLPPLILPLVRSAYHALRPRPKIQSDK